MPMGAASISLTWVMPSGTIERICSGSFWPWMAAFRLGTRLSSTRVVLPEPETPVTTVSRPLGISMSSGFTVWMALVES